MGQITDLMHKTYETAKSKGWHNNPLRIDEHFDRVVKSYFTVVSGN